MKPAFTLNFGIFSDLLSHTYNDLSKRVIPYWEECIILSLKDYDTILVVAHGNSLREILKHLYNIPENEMFKINLLTANPVILDFI
jgi:2,3-bisphosphoglycerate-dependent phosphoglycerate mutase